MTKSGLQWNSDQLKAAYYLKKGHTINQTTILSGLTLALVKKVSASLTHGDDPGEVTPEMIDGAPGATGHFAKVYATKPGGNGEKPAPGPTPAETPENPLEQKKSGFQAAVLKTAATSQSALLRLVIQQQQIILTPAIYMSYMCAVKNGYESSLGDWLSYCSEDFWLGRNRNFYAEVSGFELPPTAPVKEEVLSGQPAG